MAVISRALSTGETAVFDEDARKLYLLSETESDVVLRLTLR